MNDKILAALVAEGIKGGQETVADMATAFPDAAGHTGDPAKFAAECRQRKPHLFGARSAMAMSPSEFRDSIRGIERDAHRQAIRRHTERLIGTLAAKYS